MTNGPARSTAMSRIRDLPLYAGRFAWRWFTGQPLDGVARTDAGWFRPGYTELRRSEVPAPPETLGTEVRRDLRKFRADLGELRVRRALGRELRVTERQVMDEEDGYDERS
jgi:hypothetical protein